MSDFLKDFSPEQIKQANEDVKKLREKHPIENGVSIEEFEKVIKDKARAKLEQKLKPNKKLMIPN